MNKCTNIMKNYNQKQKENNIEKYVSKNVVQKLKGILSLNQNYTNSKSYKKENSIQESITCSKQTVKMIKSQSQKKLENIRIKPPLIKINYSQKSLDIPNRTLYVDENLENEGYEFYQELQVIENLNQLLSSIIEQNQQKDTFNTIKYFQFKILNLAHSKKNIIPQQFTDLLHLVAQVINHQDKNANYKESALQQKHQDQQYQELIQKNSSLEKNIQEYTKVIKQLKLNQQTLTDIIFQLKKDNFQKNCYFQNQDQEKYQSIDDKSQGSLEMQSPIDTYRPSDDDSKNSHDSLKNQLQPQDLNQLNQENTSTIAISSQNIQFKKKNIQINLMDLQQNKQLQNKSLFQNSYIKKMQPQNQIINNQK